MHLSARIAMGSVVPDSYANYFETILKMKNSFHKIISANLRDGLK